MLDLTPAAETLARLVEGVHDSQLASPTPCAGTSLGALLDHIDGLAIAFTAAATKTELPGGSQPPSADASRLGQDWRRRIPQRLATLADAWRKEDAWTGTTRAGGVDLPGEAAGIVALNEVVVHGWDVAAASGQSASWDEDLLAAAMTFVEQTVAEHPNGSPGLFGPPVAVPASAPLLDRLLGLTGRNPAWHP